jgi:hypothetical protein
MKPMSYPLSHCRTKFALLVAVAALLVPGMALVGGGRALAQDSTIDCSLPENAWLPECDPNSAFSAFTASNSNGTITWSATAVCTGPESGSNSCANNNSFLNGPVPNDYLVEIWGNRLEEGQTTCSTADPVYRFGNPPPA